MERGETMSTHHQTRSKTRNVDDIILFNELPPPTRASRGRGRGGRFLSGRMSSNSHENTVRANVNGAANHQIQANQSLRSATPVNQQPLVSLQNPIGVPNGNGAAINVNNQVEGSNDLQIATLNLFQMQMRQQAMQMQTIQNMVAIQANQSRSSSRQTSHPDEDNFRNGIASSVNGAAINEENEDFYEGDDEDFYDDEQQDVYDEYLQRNQVNYQIRNNVQEETYSEFEGDVTLDDVTDLNPRDLRRKFTLKPGNMAKRTGPLVNPNGLAEFQARQKQLQQQQQRQQRAPPLSQFRTSSPNSPTPPTPVPMRNVAPRTQPQATVQRRPQAVASYMPMSKRTGETCDCWLCQGAKKVLPVFDGKTKTVIDWSGEIKALQYMHRWDDRETARRALNALAGELVERLGQRRIDIANITFTELIECLLTIKGERATYTQLLRDLDSCKQGVNENVTEFFARFLKIHARTGRSNNEDTSLCVQIQSRLLQYLQPDALFWLNQRSASNELIHVEQFQTYCADLEMMLKSKKNLRYPDPPKPKGDNQVTTKFESRANDHQFKKNTGAARNNNVQTNGTQNFRCMACKSDSHTFDRCLKKCPSHPNTKNHNRYDCNQPTDPDHVRHLENIKRKKEQNGSKSSAPLNTNRAANAEPTSVDELVADRSQFRGQPYLSAKLNNQRVVVLADGGARISAISQNFAKLLNLTPQGQIELQVADGRPTKCGLTEANLEIGYSGKHRVQFAILPRKDNAILLSSYDCVRMKVVFNFENMSATVDGVNVPVLRECVPDEKPTAVCQSGRPFTVVNFEKDYSPFVNRIDVTSAKFKCDFICINEVTIPARTVAKIEVESNYLGSRMDVITQRVYPKNKEELKPTDSAPAINLLTNSDADFLMVTNLAYAPVVIPKDHLVCHGVAVDYVESIVAPQLEHSSNIELKEIITKETLSATETEQFNEELANINVEELVELDNDSKDDGTVGDSEYKKQDDQIKFPEHEWEEFKICPSLSQSERRQIQEQLKKFHKLFVWDRSKLRPANVQPIGIDLKENHRVWRIPHT